MIKFFVISILLLISGFYISDAFADTQNLSGSSHGNEISLKFSDGKVSGVITLEGHTINLSDVKVIERHDRLFIVDKQNGLKILSKQLSSNNYLIIVKINSEDIQTKLRFIANSESVNKNTGQRNLFDAMEQKMLDNQKKELDTMTPAELKFLAKQKAIDAALKVRDERLAKIAEEKSKISDDVLDPKKILEEFRKFQALKSRGPELLLKDEIKEVKKVDVVVNHVNIKTFLSIPHHQEWKKVLRFTVIVTDDVGRQYHLTYKDYVGNPMSDVQISGTIKNPTNNVLQTFSGTTDNSGEYLGTFLIPDQSTTRGEYGISVYAVKTFKDDSTTTSSNDGIFFVFPRSGGGGSFATGTVTLDTVIGANHAAATATLASVLVSDTLVLNSLTYTAVTGTASDNTEFSIDGDNDADAAALSAAINSRDSTNVSTTTSTNIVTIYAVTLDATTGDAITLTETGAIVVTGGGTLGGATSGTDVIDEVTLNGLQYSPVTDIVLNNGEFVSGVSNSADATALNNAINADARSGTLGDLSSTVTTNTVTITTNVLGTDGNAITLAKTGTTITISGSTLSGGVN